MKIAITGHSRGIGKAIAEILGHREIVGMSRSNGFDISNVNQILDAGKDCDVFINNAYLDYYQEDLLKLFHKEWYGTDKLIINIGSIVTDYPRIEKHLDHEEWPYRNHKRALRDTFRKLIKEEASCRMVLISPGATDTDMIKHHGGVKMNPNKVAIAVLHCLHNPVVKELVLYEK